MVKTLNELAERDGNERLFAKWCCHTRVRDRDNKKWVAMMLPEHLKLIREYVVEQKKISKPELDKWDLDIIQDNVQIAMKRNVDVEVKTRKNGEFNFQIGSISWVDLKRRTIEMEDV